MIRTKSCAAALWDNRRNKDCHCLHFRKMIYMPGINPSVSFIFTTFSGCITWKNFVFSCVGTFQVLRIDNLKVHASNEPIRFFGETTVWPILLCIRLKLWTLKFSPDQSILMYAFSILNKHLRWNPHCNIFELHPVMVYSRFIFI